MDVKKAIKYLIKLLQKLEGVKKEGYKMADVPTQTNVEDLFKDKT